MLTHTCFAQKKYSIKEDTFSINSLINATYEVVSGVKGEKRQWQRDASLHHPMAIYSYKNRKGVQVTIPVKDFHKDTEDLIMKTDFFESEINREVRVFGNIAQVWSTYETRFAKNGSVEKRGINSIQLIYEKNRWWIISWVFDSETESNRIPKTFDRN